MVSVFFECFCKETKFGESVQIVGNCNELNQWVPKHTTFLTTSVNEYPVWRSEPIVFSLETTKTPIEFKFIITDQQGRIRWENGPNRVLKIDKQFKDSTICISAQYDNSNTVLNIVNNNDLSPVSKISSPLSSSVGSPSSCEGIPRWEGRDITFVKSRSALKRLEDNIKNTTAAITSFPLSSETLCYLLEGNIKAHSFLSKLKLVESLVCKIQLDPLNDTNNRLKTGKEVLELLSAIAVYLTFIQTGIIPCTEEGGHYRPHHHASAANKIFTILTQLSKTEHQKNTTYRVDDLYHEAIILLVRRILPLLPSFSKNFTCSVPLTRIRDIAHRNDIPSDLKQEIKHTLQNKLHRSAGPEDLIAAQSLLKKILEQSSQYSQEFVNEFIKFNHELKEFFNAQSLEEHLARLGEFLQGESTTIDSKSTNQWLKDVQDFLKIKHQILAAPNVRLILEGLERSVCLRESIATIAEAKPESQNLWLTDIALEQFSFTLLAQFNSYVVKTTQKEVLALNELCLYWIEQLHAMYFAIRHVQLNGFLETECQAILKSLEGTLLDLSNLKTHTTDDIAQNRSLKRALRQCELKIRAIVERARHIADVTTEVVNSVFLSVVQDVGKAVSAPPHSISIFAEADVRASIVFQAARLISSLLCQILDVLGESGIEIIVQPQKEISYIAGHVIVVDKLEDLAPLLENESKNKKMPILLRLNSATGDEEIAALVGIVEAIIVMHSIPILSHLGIRAKQSNIPFIAVVNSESEFVDKLDRSIGKDTTLHFTADGVDILEGLYQNPSDLKGDDITSQSNALTSPSQKRETLPINDVAVRTKGLPAVFKSQEVTEPTCGSKATHCAKLIELSKTNKNMFDAPQCVVLPFGWMEYVIKFCGKDEQYRQFLSTLDNIADLETSSQAIHAYQELSALLDSLSLSDKFMDVILQQVLLTWGQNGALPTDLPTLIIRSSANVEDTERLSAAGLYESIANINPKDPSMFANAILKVWASLHSRRAILSRKAFGIAQHSARMAVLIQNMIFPQLSFVAHTVAPLPMAVIKRAVIANDIQLSTVDLALTSQNDGQKTVAKECDYCHPHSPTGWIYTELALGMGEALAGARLRGTSHRLLICKATGDYAVLAFSSLSSQYVAMKGEDNKPNDERLKLQICDYSSDWFWKSETFRKVAAEKLHCVCMALEKEFGKAQDIEGAICYKEDAISTLQLHIVQTRPQPL